MRWSFFGIVLTLALPTQGQNIPRHYVANWKQKPSYVFTYEFIAPGDLGTAARMNSCSVAGVPPAMQCSGRGYCRSWSNKFVAGAPPRVSFCECNHGWADPECRTPRRSQTTAYLLSLFLGFLGVDQMYLGSAAFGIAKFFSFGGFGFWWLYDIVRIGSGPVYTGQHYRVAEDLDHLVFVLSSVCFLLLVGFLMAFYSVVRNSNQKRREALLLQEEEEKSILRSLSKIDADKNIMPDKARMVGQRAPAFPIVPTPAPLPRTARSLSPASLVSGTLTVPRVGATAVPSDPHHYYHHRGNSPRAAARAPILQPVRSLSPAPLASAAPVPMATAPASPVRTVRSLSPVPLVSAAPVQTHRVPQATAPAPPPRTVRSLSPARAPTTMFAPAPPLPRNSRMKVPPTSSSVRRPAAVRSLSPTRVASVLHPTTSSRRMSSPPVVRERAPSVSNTTTSRRQSSPPVLPEVPASVRLSREMPAPVRLSRELPAPVMSSIDVHGAKIRTVTETPAIEIGGELRPTGAPHVVETTVTHDRPPAASSQGAPALRGRSSSRTPPPPREAPRGSLRSEATDSERDPEIVMESPLM